MYSKIIYIFIDVALDETNISSCLLFSLQDVKNHVIKTVPLSGVMSAPANKKGLND